MTDQTSPRPAGVNTEEFDVIVVGAGFSGVYMIHKLVAQGLKVVCFEAGDGVGGTWYWNRYPGARCDVESLEYSYGFSDAIQQEWRWSHRYAEQPEILSYINHVADRLDLKRHIRFEQRVLRQDFDEATRRWTVGTDKGDRARARYVVMASGNLSIPRVPDFKGLENFRGDWYHSGLWPREGVDFTGRTVGLIGTGATGIQMVPKLAAQARHLTVFQRTANFSVPARNRPLDDAADRAHKATYAERRQAAKNTSFGISNLPTATRSAFDLSEEERFADYEARWTRGGSPTFLSAYNDLVVSREANETAAEFVRGKVRSIVRDAGTAELLAPKDHPIGTKRLCVDTDYYETYNRDNVSLVDVRSAPIEEITENGIRTTEKEYAFDSIVFATGFDAMTGALLEIDIRGRDGEPLKEAWAHGPTTYLGLMVHGFPNMFIVTGPGSPSVKSNMVCSIEQHVEWISDCIEWLDGNGHVSIEPTAGDQAAWVAHVNEVADGTLFPLADSWYIGANIPGKPRVFMPYVGGIPAYRKKCDEVVAAGYQGFMLDGADAAARVAAE